MIRIAAGEELNLAQNKIRSKGWAIESRIYAEDPYRDFMPSIGRLTKYLTPDSSKEVRVDTGIREGSEVSMFYDPMIAKLITYGKTRNEAIEKMLGAIDQYVITGVSHNLNFLSSIMQNHTFQSGYTTTNFIEEEYQEGFKGQQETDEDKEMVASFLAAYHVSRLKRIVSNHDLSNHWTVKVNEKEIAISVQETKSSLVATTQSGEFEIHFYKQPSDPRVRLEINGNEYHVQIQNNSPGYQLIYRGKIFNALVTRQRTAELNALMPETSLMQFQIYVHFNKEQFLYLSCSLISNFISIS